MRKEFIVERQGRSFVLYAGLLDIAHQQGLRSVRTELIQTPDETNQMVAVCSAIVVLEKDGEQRSFMGIGDASPRNVAPAMQHCLIRMAETRAKARALRDAVNVGVAAFEELGEADAHDGSPERGYPIYGGARGAKGAPPAPKRAPSPSAPAPVANGAGGGITEQQVWAVRSLCQRLHVEETEEVKRFGANSLQDLTRTQASEIITALNVRAKTTPGA